MPIIDDEGRLFGTVNIIDALVVLFVLAVVVAGVALVNPFGGSASEPATRYATVDLGTHPDFVADQVSAGDRLVEAAEGDLTVTDVYYTPGSDGQVRVIARVELRGSVSDESETFQYAGQPLQRGGELPLQTPDYEVTGTVTRVDRNGTTLRTADTALVVRTVVSADAAEEFDVGDAYTLADTEVATVESLQFYPGDGDRVTAILGLSVRTRLEGGDRHFGQAPLTVGRSIPFRTSAYGFNGTVSQLGTATPNTTTTDVVLESTVPATTADALAAGDTYRVRGTPVATVDSVQVYPTGNPAEKRVLVGATLQTITRDRGPAFAGTPVKLGTTVPLRTDTYDISGAVVRVGSQEPPGEVTETTVRLQLDNVSPEVADSVRTGMTETTDGTTFATITRKTSANATVVLTSDDGNIYRRQHPVNRDVSLTVDLRARATGSGLTFHGRTLQENSQVVLDLGTTTVRGTVTEIQS
jgi:hypothetical protein